MRKTLEKAVKLHDFIIKSSPKRGQYLLIIFPSGDSYNI